MNFLHNCKWFLVYHYLSLWFSFYQQAKLWITISLHAAIVDVGRSTNEVPVIDDHQFGVQVYDLSIGLFVNDSMVSKTVKLYIVTEIGGVSFFYDPTQQAVFSSADCFVLPVHYHSWQRGWGVIELPRKARHQWHHNENFEILIHLYGPDNSICNCLHDPVFHHSVFVGCGNKKLVFDVDELLGLCYQWYVGIINRFLEILWAYRPLWSGS